MVPSPLCTEGNEPVDGLSREKADEGHAILFTTKTLFYATNGRHLPSYKASSGSKSKKEETSSGPPGLVERQNIFIREK